MSVAQVGWTFLSPAALILIWFEVFLRMWALLKKIPGWLAITASMFVLSGCQWPLFNPESGQEAIGTLQAATPLAIQATKTTTPGVRATPTVEQEKEAQPSEAYPAVVLPEASPVLPYPGTTLETEGAYPGLSAPPVQEAYPAMPTLGPTSTDPGSGEPYPALGQPEAPVTGESSPQPPAESYPAPNLDQSTPTASAGQETATSEIMLTPMASLTPENTPTAQPTPTVIPPPPWVQSKLSAANPLEVRLASGKVQLIEFFAFWCGPCQAMAPLVHGLEERYKTRVNFVYLDIDDPRTKDIEKLLGYKSQPHFFLVDAYGRVLVEWVGAVPVETLIQALDAALK